MKIKAVCEKTGLTDRTIRYYIDEKLISPSYTENYLGRKTFDFSDENIKELHDIAVLRKFGFSISEIREMLLFPQKSMEIIKDIQQRKEAVISQEQDLLSALAKLDPHRVYTVSELAKTLSEPIGKALPPNEIVEKSISKTLKALIKRCVKFIIVWLPIVLSFQVFIDDITYYSYPVVNPIISALTLLSLVPSVFIIVLPKLKISRYDILKRILLILCVLCIPVSSFFSSGIITESKTTDFRNYRDFDTNCIANRNIVFQELFPLWPNYFENVRQADGSFETVYLDAKYYYRYIQGFDYTYDIYAEWPLEENDFNIELERAAAVFDKAVAEKTYNYKFVNMQKGSFNCLILYSGNEPFAKATNSYDYIIFAYDKERKIVRYIYCDSLENGVDQPYYLQLEW